MIQVTKKDIEKILDDYSTIDLDVLLEKTNSLFSQEKVIDFVLAFKKLILEYKDVNVNLNINSFIYDISAHRSYPMIEIVLKHKLDYVIDYKDDYIREIYNQLGVENIYDIEEYNNKIGNAVLNDLSDNHEILSFDTELCNIVMTNGYYITTENKPTLYMITTKNELRGNYYIKIILLTDYTYYKISYRTDYLNRATVTISYKDLDNNSFESTLNQKRVTDIIRTEKLKYINTL